MRKANYFASPQTRDYICYQCQSVITNLVTNPKTGFFSTKFFIQYLLTNLGPYWFWNLKTISPQLWLIYEPMRETHIVEEDLSMWLSLISFLWNNHVGRWCALFFISTKFDKHSLKWAILNTGPFECSMGKQIYVF